MKRMLLKAISCFVTLVITFACLSPLAISASAASVTVKKLSTLIDGEKKTISYRIVNDVLYVGANALTKALAGTEKPFTAALIKDKTVKASSIKVKKSKYYSLDDIAKSMDFSCTYDKILSSVYIWTNLPYAQASSDAQRAYENKLITKKQLNNPNGQISCKAFANMLIKMLKKQAPDKLA